MIKRMGYLAQLLKTEQLADFIAFAQKQVNQKYTLLEPGAPDEGAFNKRWQLLMNMTEATILDTINGPY